MNELEEELEKDEERVEMGMERMKELRIVRINMEEIKLIENIMKRYKEMKRRRGIMEFEEMIKRKVEMIERNGEGKWVKYKIERGIDNILVDEEKDKRKDKWKVIRML